MSRHLKSIALYVVILALGLGAGRLAPTVQKWWTPSYVEGDFSAYYQDQKMQVVLFGTPTCPYCAKARAFMKQHGIAYQDVDLSTSARGRDDFNKLEGSGVPLILVGQRRISGFDEGALESALKKIGVM